MNNFLLRIRNLEIKLEKEKDPVLIVPKLDIPYGKVVFILGVSGSGKTTLVEALGLMSQNYDKDKSQIVLTPYRNGVSYDYKDIWEDEELASAIRRDYFGFMFQQTNMLPTIEDVKENVALTAIIDNIPKAESIDKALEHLEKIRMKGIAHKSIKKISGGQGQRASFARAVIAGGCILIADEPTGNLGNEDSQSVMETIIEVFIKSKYTVNTASDNAQVTRENSAIIVSHNLDMALKYADIIVVIQESPDKYDDPDNLKSNFICDKNIIGEEEKKKTPEAELREKIKKLMKTGADAYKQEEKISGCSIYKQKKFKDNVFRKFYGEITQKELVRSGIFFVVFLWLVFMVLGGAKGSLNKLEEKMKNPFVKSFSIDVSYEDRFKIPDILKLEPAILDSLSVSSITGYNRYFLNVYNNRKKGGSVAYCRTLSTGPLCDELAKPEFLEAGSLFVSDKDIGVVVTLDFMNNYGYSDKDAFIYMMMFFKDKEIKVPVPIRGIVKNLPGGNHIVSTPYFLYMRYYDREGEAPFNPMNTKRVKFFVPGAVANANELVTVIEGYLKSNNEYANQNYATFIPESNISQKPWIEGSEIIVSFIPPLENYESVANLSDQILNLESTKKYNIVQVPEYPVLVQREMEFSESKISY